MRTSAKQLEADKRHWQQRLDELGTELDTEPARIRAELRRQGHALRAGRARVSLAGDRLMAMRSPRTPGARRMARPDPARSASSCRRTCWSSTACSSTGRRAVEVQTKLAELVERRRARARRRLRSRSSATSSGGPTAPGRRAGRPAASRTRSTVALPEHEDHLRPDLRRAGSGARRRWLLLVQVVAGDGFRQAPRRMTQRRRLARQPARAARAPAARNRRADRPPVQRHVASASSTRRRASRPAT